MIKNILLFLSGLIIGALAILITLLIKNHNYYLDRPWWKGGYHYDLKVRVHATCDSILVINAKGETLNQFTHLIRPDQLMLSYESSEMNVSPFSVKAYIPGKTLSIDSLFIEDKFEKIIIEEDNIEKDTVQ
jgi:hypothetical protein